MSTALKLIESLTPDTSVLQNTRSSGLPQQPVNFWSVWLQHQDYLFKRCQYWMGGNLTNAEDALSQAMIKAWELWPRVASELRSPRAWLIRLTHNLCVDLHRKSGRQAIATEQIETEATSLNSATISPVEIMLQDELKQVLRKEIQNLPAKLRVTFSNYYLREQSTKEISHQLSISENNVYKRLQKAREQLRHRLTTHLYYSQATHLVHVHNAMQISKHTKEQKAFSLNQTSPAQPNFTATKKSEISS